MNSTKDITSIIQSYFNRYLVGEYGASKDTIRAYRDTLLRFIEFMESIKHVKPEKLSIDNLTRNNVMTFLDWIEEDRHNSVNTRNSRLAAIKSLVQYLIHADPTRLGQWKSILNIKNKKSVMKAPVYLTSDGVKCLLKHIPLHCLHGERDLVMIALMYNLAVRVSELIGLTPSCIRTTKPFVAKIHGKGKKERYVGIDDAMMELLLKYMHTNLLDKPGNGQRPLFSNCHQQKLTNAGVTYILQKYADMARKDNPELIPNVLSPHTLRHSRAMNMLNDGANLMDIRDLLGHKSVKTTELYARIDSKNKRKALEDAYSDIGITEPHQKTWEKEPKIKKMLKELI